MEGIRSKILILDDERLIADTLKRIFEKKGYEPRAAYSAEEAMEIFSSWSPDLAIIDVILPLMNGIDFAILLRSQIPTCHVLLLSGQAATYDLLAEANKKGRVFEILAKPVHPLELLKSASKLLENNRPAIFPTPSTQLAS